MEKLDKENQENEGKESLSQGMEIQDVLAPNLISHSFIPKVDEDWGNQLWEAVKRTYGKTRNEIKPPIEELNFGQKTLKLEIRFEQEDFGSKTSHESKVENFKPLPS